MAPLDASAVARLLMNVHDAPPCAEAIRIVRVRTAARPRVSPPARYGGISDPGLEGE